METPGFRFYPTEEELILFYLKPKIEPRTNYRCKQNIHNVIPDLNVYDFSPSDLAQYAGELCQGDTDQQWFFFIPRQDQEACGGRQSRLTNCGYWKATGTLSTVYSSSNRAIGIKRTMVFYEGRAPTGRKTEWMMNEYNAFQDQSSNTNGKPTVMKDFSVCRIYVKSNSFREFDRRPSGVMIYEQPLQNNEHHASTSTQPSLPLITTSLSDRIQDSSCHQPANFDPHSMLENDVMHLWDWDELDKWL